MRLFRRKPKPTPPPQPYPDNATAMLCDTWDDYLRGKPTYVKIGNEWRLISVKPGPGGRRR